MRIPFSANFAPCDKIDSLVYGRALSLRLFPIGISHEETQAMMGHAP